MATMCQRVKLRPSVATLCMEERKECSVPGLLDAPLVVKYWMAIYKKKNNFPNFERTFFFNTFRSKCFSTELLQVSNTFVPSINLMQV